MNPKIILAFSGGLDTSFCVAHLKEQGYEVITVTVNTGGFGSETLEALEKKALSLGSSKHYSIDAEEKIYSQIISHLIRLDGLYEGEYPLMCADRYIIAEEVLAIAKKENASFVSHGSTSVGNDQVRFDSALLTLNPSIQILCPIKELAITRAQEITYLESKGFAVSKGNKQYSINQNVFGVTLSGSEIDAYKEPSSDAYQLTQLTQKNPAYVTLEFEQGLPITLNGIKKNGLAILKEINTLVGAFGIGRGSYTGDCIIGIKGHIVFEAPGLFALLEAHKKLQQVTLTKKQLQFHALASAQWADVVYSGLYYEPLARSLEAYAAAEQAKVTGTVKLKLAPLCLSIVEVESPYSLMKNEIATYAQKGSWSAQEANGFIKLYTLQQKIAWSK